MFEPLWVFWLATGSLCGFHKGRDSLSHFSISNEIPLPIAIYPMKRLVLPQAHPNVCRVILLTIDLLGDQKIKLEWLGYKVDYL